MPVVMWFRRDLRLTDNPALAAAAAAGNVLALFVLDPTLTQASGLARLHVLHQSLRALDDQLGGRLVIRHGRPTTVLPAVCREFDVSAVHAARDFGPYGAGRDEAVRAALDVPLTLTGSSYAVDPGTINRDGHGYQVYSAFYRGWSAHGSDAPTAAVQADWVKAESDELPTLTPLAGVALPKVGELAANQAWQQYRTRGLADYQSVRDRPDLDATSRMSVHLKWGTIHPRTMLADLAAGDETYRKELAWREFYADVLHRRPDSAREYYRSELKGLTLRMPGQDDEDFTAWKQGQTGYPIVDAGMRQLLSEGWMHNRVRMIVASFLVKDLHIEWLAGARHFMRHLIDGDLASNNHGWQWTAGTGTDASPFFRIFNPLLQGKKFDPDGDYVRRWVPELAHLSAKHIHEPHSDPHGAPADYPAPIVDHHTEKAIALADYQSLSSLRSRSARSEVTL
jgi:deoxyribodipyrimidine photo-lyase